MISRGRTTPSLALTAAALCAAAACSNTVDGAATAADTTTPGTTTTTTSATTTTTTTTTTARAAADPEDYRGSDPSMYYFLSESGKFECAVLMKDDPIAGCQGAMPPSAPRVPASGAPDVTVPANVVLLNATSAAEFVNVGDIAFMDPTRSAQALPYGESLTVGPFTCSVDATAGVTCETGQHGFTVSDSDYELW